MTAHSKDSKYAKEKIKLVEKEKKKKTAEELKEKSKKALGDIKLIEIVSDIIKDGKINLTQVKKSAFDYVLNKTGDLQKSEELAKAARWLAMLKRDYPAVFEEMLYEKEMEERRKSVIEKDLAMKYPKPEPKFEPKDVEIELFGDIILSDAFLHPRRFLRIKAEKMPQRAIIMAQSFLEAITGVVYRFEGTERTIAHPVGLRNYLIQILEEKGLTIKICGNCEWFKPYPSHSTPDGRCRHPVNMYNGPWAEEQCNFGDHCHVNPDGWVSKKNSEEKKEEEKK